MKIVNSWLGEILVKDNDVKRSEGDFTNLMRSDHFYTLKSCFNSQNFSNVLA